MWAGVGASPQRLAWAGAAAEAVRVVGAVAVFADLREALREPEAPASAGPLRFNAEDAECEGENAEGRTAVADSAGATALRA